MSKFKKFVNSLGVFANKAAKETVKITDVSASKLKIKAEEARLCDRYESLGRIAEAYLRADGALPENITEALGEIDRTKARISDLKSELDDKRTKYKEAKQK